MLYLYYPPFYCVTEVGLGHLEHDLHVIHLILVPAGPHEGLVEEAENDQVLGDLLAQVVVDPVHLRTDKSI